MLLFLRLEKSHLQSLILIITLVCNKSGIYSSFLSVAKSVDLSQLVKCSYTVCIFTHLAGKNWNTQFHIIVTHYLSEGKDAESFQGIPKLSMYRNVNSIWFVFFSCIAGSDSAELTGTSQMLGVGWACWGLLAAVGVACRGSVYMAPRNWSAMRPASRSPLSRAPWTVAG